MTIVFSTFKMYKLLATTEKFRSAMNAKFDCAKHAVEMCLIIEYSITFIGKNDTTAMRTFYYRMLPQQLILHFALS